ncbi:TonB-dependent receptor [Flavivirga jejuensis]|uniref:TonB-dependent receptor n=1 Tax=Flavivirga jejuensis TaxID=870487 RepID=A0ABT8WJ37_9FLAO|nr:TonB-dependent receptor [Flavivirga jejuensis]MDO5973174.1 TonB-dependent receptor [Flavivirga jejuensis]
MKKQLTFVSFLLLSIFTFAQSGTIKGTIIDASDDTFFGVNVIIKNTTKGAQTNEDGQFEITNIENGDYILSISYLGYKTKEVAFSLNNDQVLDLGSIKLYEGNELLQEVILDTERKNKFSRKQSAYVAKMPLKNMENSQVYTTITNQLLVSQSVNNFEDALKNAVGVDKLWSSTGRSGDGAGYYSIRGFSVQPQLVNGVAGITNGFINPSNVERVEVIKGPSATLFGSTVTSYGGLINIVTKKPYNGNGGSISIAGGSFDYRKLNADINITENENLSLRLNAGYQEENSFQDYGFKKSVFIAPSVSYKISNKLTLNFAYEASDNEQTNQTFLFLNRSVPLVFNTIEALNYDTNLSLTSNDVTINNITQNYRGEIAYKISDNWSSQSIVAGGIAKSNGYYTYLWNYADWTDVSNPLATPYFSLNAQNSDARTKTLNLQQNFTGDFKLGSFQNKLLVGIDYLKSKIIDESSGFAYLHTVTAQGDLPFGEPIINANNIDTALLGSENSDIDINQNVLGAYISNVIKILPNLSAMASIRYDRFNYDGDKNDPSDDEQVYEESAFSPKFGIVFQPILNELSVFANYQNSFSYVSPEIVPVDMNDPDAGVTVQSYDLEHANQLEFGMKTNLFNNKLEATLSFYNIEVKDKIMGFGADKQQDATVKSQGIELEVNTNPISGLNLRGGFSYNNAEVTASISRPDLIGVRTSESGSDILYNFWGDYQFKEGFAKNFGFGAGFNGASDYDTMSDYTITEGFILPAYTIFNASVYYETKKIRISLKGNNLTDETYYSGWSTVTPQQTRAFLANITYSF